MPYFTFDDMLSIPVTNPKSSSVLSKVMLLSLIDEDSTCSDW